jgi:hypothetical protein
MGMRYQINLTMFHLKTHSSPQMGYKSSAPSALGILEVG